MKLFRIDDMSRGWFVGNFDPTAYKTDKFEVCYRIHPKGEKWDTHYHHTVTEVNLLIKGKMTLQDHTLITGDIFILEPFEIAAPEFLEDCEMVVVKVPSLNDKIIMKE